MTTTMKAKDIGIGDVIDLGRWNGCRPDEALWRVQRIRIERHGPNKGLHIFYGVDGFGGTDLIGYGRPNTMIPIQKG